MKEQIETTVYRKKFVEGDSDEARNPRSIIHATFLINNQTISELSE